MTRARLIFVTGLVGWAAGFALLGRSGTLYPLLAVSVGLSALALAIDPTTRALVRPSGRLLGVAIAAVAVMLGGTWAFAKLGGDRVTNLTAGPFALLGGAGLGNAAAAVVIGLIATSEEILFRGSVLPATADGAWRRPAWREVGVALGASLLFGAAHLTSGSLALAAVACVAGTTWALLRVASGSIIPGIVSHVAWDLVFVVFWPLGS